MQSLPPPPNYWYDVRENEPDHTGEWDCRVNDDCGGIFDAVWIPSNQQSRRGDEGPGWLVLGKRTSGVRRRPYFMPASHVKRWKPARRKSKRS